MTTARSSLLFVVAASSCLAFATCAAAGPATGEEQGAAEISAGLSAAGREFPANDGERGASQCKTMTILTRGMVAEAGRRLLELEVRNSGERLLSSAISVDLFRQGEAVAQFRTVLQGIAPGRFLRHRIDLSELPCGRYQALTIVQSRDGDISGSREELDVE